METRRNTLTLPFLVVLFSACVVSRTPPEGTPSEDDAPVFDDTIVHEIEIEVDSSLISELRLDNDERIPATFVFDGIVLEDVGIRLKGHNGSGREMDGKAQFSVKFDEFRPEQRLYGLKKLIINNDVSFPSFISRRLGYEIWRRAGVPTPRTAYAHVTFNGEYFGLYVIEEAAGKRFLRRHFADPSGNLYEGEGEDITDIEGVDLDTNEDENDRSDLIALSQALSAPPEELLDAVGAQVDLDQFYTYWAVERLVYHWDAYGTVRDDNGCCAPNNYYAYRDPSQGRFVFLPRGADVLFRQVDANVGNLPAERAVLAFKLFALPEVRAALAQRMREILDTVWDVPALLAYIDASEAIVLDAFIEGGREESSLASIRFGFDQTRDFIEGRPQVVRERLEQGL